MNLQEELDRARSSVHKAKSVILNADDYTLLDELSKKTTVNKSRLLGIALKLLQAELITKEE